VNKETEKGKILEIPVSERTLKILKKKGIDTTELKEHARRNIELMAKYKIPRIRGGADARR